MTEASGEEISSARGRGGLPAVSSQEASTSTAKTDQSKVLGHARFYPGLSDRTIDRMKKDFFRPRDFPAGTWLAQPGRPLPGAFFVDSGLISATDDSAVDFIWPGIVFDTGSTFGEYALLEGAKPFPSTLRALTDVKTWYISPDYFYKALQDPDPELKDLRRMVEDRVRLDLLLPDIVKALNRYPPTADVPMSRLVELARLAEVCEVQPNCDVRASLKDGDWVFVATGEVEGGGMRIPEGSTFIYVDGIPKEVRAALSPRDGKTTQIVRLPRQQHEQVAARSFHVRQALELMDLQPAAARRTEEKIGFVALGRGQVPAAMALFFAETLRRMPVTRFEKVGLLVVRPEEAAGSDVAHAGLQELRDTNIEIRETTPEKAESVLGEMKAEIVVFETSRAPSAWLQSKFPDLITKAVVVNQGLVDELPPGLRGKQVVRAVTLGEVPPGDYIAYYPGTVRLAFDNPNRMARCRFDELSDRDKKSFQRLARAAIEMRVGLALGGGGSWGYAHVALLQELDNTDVPIDIISGVSFGSLAGGFYAAGGVESMKVLVEQGLIFQAYLVASGLSPLPGLAESYVNHCLGGKRLEYLETPFFPVGLDLNSGAEWSYGTGTVGYGVRAASALPGLLPPLVDVAKGIRSIDGCYINNVPEGILIREGADFVIASDVVQMPPEMPESRWSKLLSVCYPLSRINDNMRGLATLAKIGNDRDAEYANLTFRPPLSSVPIMDFRRAAVIVEQARDAAHSFAAGASKAYRAAMTVQRGKARS